MIKKPDTGPHLSNNRDTESMPVTVALKYDGENAPHVVAKGTGLLAERIMELAAENDVPLYEDPDLVLLLSKLELGDEIPTTLYVAVAEVIAFAYQLSGKSAPQYPVSS